MEDKTLFINHIRYNIDNEFYIDKVSDVDKIFSVLVQFDSVFSPPLSKRISDMKQYAEKLAKHSCIYVVQNRDAAIVGFISFYANDKIDHNAFINQLAIEPAYHNTGLGQYLLDTCICLLKDQEMKSVNLEVDNKNSRAIKFYIKNGFVISGQAKTETTFMIKTL